MTRPLYEEQKHRDAAYDAAQEIEHKTAIKVEMGPPLAAWNFILHRKNKAIAIADFKERYNAKDRYDTYFVSERRVLGLLDEAEKRGLRPMLFVRWRDGLYWLDIGPDAHVDRKLGGRYDRKDPDDVEYMLHYWSKDFKRV